MAPISKFISFLFLTTLSLSLQTNARDSQFFSKVTYNNNKGNEVPQNKEASAVNKPGEQQPVFMPENENSYGLYGHESGLHPPMDDTNAIAHPYTTTNGNNYKPYKTTTDQEDTNNNNNFYNFQKDADSTTNYPNEISDTRLTGTSFNNKESYDTKYTGEQRFNSMENQYGNKFNYNNNKDANNYETKLTGEGYNSMENQNNNKYNYNNNEKYYFNNNNDRYSSFKNKAATNNYNSERLGMSDTRAMEGGKYFYDVNSDKYKYKYNPTTTYDQGSSKGVINSENRGYFGNNKNSMEGNYQNQEEFENDQEEFEP